MKRLTLWLSFFLVGTLSLPAQSADKPNILIIWGDDIGQFKVSAYLMPFLKGEEEASPRKEFLYWTDDGNVAALRYNNWKITFLRQNAHGMHVWQAPYEQLRMPMVGNLRSDPFERAHKEGIGYPKWQFEHMFAFAPAGAYVGEWLQSFKEFPPRQKPGSFSLDRVMESITRGAGDK